MSYDVIGKRTRRDDDDYYLDYESPKKNSKDKSRISSLYVTYDTFYDETAHSINAVHISSTTLKKIGNPPYIRIGRYVAPTVIDRTCCEDAIKVFGLFRDKIIYTVFNERIDNTIEIKPYPRNAPKCVDSAYVQFNVRGWRVFDNIGATKGETILLSNSLAALIPKQLGNQVLRMGQEFFVRHPVVGPLRLVVDRCRLIGEDQIDLLHAANNVEYGFLDSETQVGFRSDDVNITIVEEYDSRDVEEFCMKILNVKKAVQRGFENASSLTTVNEWKRGLSPLPLIISNSKLENRIKETWVGKLIYPGIEMKVIVGDWKFSVRFSHVQIKKNVQMEPTNGNKKAFCLYNQHRIYVEGGNNVILTSSDINIIHPASQVILKVNSWDISHPVESNKLNWANVHEIKRFVRENISNIPLKGTIVVSSGDLMMQLKVVDVIGPKIPQQKGLSQLWKLSDSTEIVIDVGVFSKSIELVRDEKIYPLKSIKVTVTKKGADATKSVLHEHDILSAFRNALPIDGIVSEMKEIYGMSHQGIELAFKLNQFVIEGDLLVPSLYRSLRTVTPKTLIEVNGEKQGNVLVERPVNLKDSEDIYKKLVEVGLGGAPEELVDYIKWILLSRGKYRPYFLKNKLGYSRGLLLHGPAGTGKTLTGRKIAQMLNIPEERMQFLTGSDILSKWVGESEANIRKMFENARKDQIERGDDSPLYVLFIDEIDSILSNRTSESKSWEVSQVGTFLAQMDGCLELNNIIVIGATNKFDRIDPAVKRMERLGTHVFMGLPNFVGRKDIFTIHTEGLRLQSKILPDVDFNVLAEESAGLSGADIKGIVNKAGTYHIPRCETEKIDCKDLINHPSAKISMDDFRQAIRQCIKSERLKPKEELFVPTPGASIQSITFDLQRLGMVGVPIGILNFLLDLRISQLYKKDRITTKQELPKGVLLYGPPGTGKSMIARLVEKLLFLDKNRFQYYCASQLWPQQGEKLLQSISAAIQPAKNASRDQGAEAPLHVIVINEINWIFASNKVSERESGVQMGHFIKEVQNLFINEGLAAHNVLIIGITSGNIPAEILKGFSMSTPAKLLEVPLPSSKERKIMFDYFLDEIIKRKQVDEETISEIVRKTEGKSGLFIKKWVSEAVTLMYRKAAEEGVTPDDVANKVKLDFSFFDDTYNDVAGEEIHRNNYM